MRIDARELDEFFRFDRILLDAPCTGTGTVVSGNEKSLRGLTEQLLGKCARSQRALLDRAMGALKPGGTLVYSTCSILPQENEDALQEALDKHMDCELIPSTARRAKVKRAVLRKLAKSRASRATPSPRPSPPATSRPSPTVCPAR